MLEIDDNSSVFPNNITKSVQLSLKIAETFRKAQLAISGRKTDIIPSYVWGSKNNKEEDLQRSRRGLPLLFGTTEQEVMTCYDTGTHENHISYPQAVAMGYTIKRNTNSRVRFQLLNGRMIRPLGYVDVSVQFAKRVGPKAASMVCRFNVFEKLALPVLIGMAFLRATETITKYTSRMVYLPSTWKRSLRLCAIGSATNQVACIIDGRRVSAASDTGSEIALISGDYARKRGFTISQGCEELELADGSLEYTSGFADLNIGVLDPDDWKRKVGSKSKWRLKPGLKTKSRVIRFHVLEGLKFDVILDEEATDSLNVFKDGFATFLSAASSMIPGICPIIHLRSVEASLAQASESVGKKTKELCTSLRSKYTSMFSTATSSQGATTPATPTSTNDAASQARVHKIPVLISQLDQAENRRLDQLEKGGTYTGADIQEQRYELERAKLLDELRGLSGTQSP